MKDYVIKGMPNDVADDIRSIVDSGIDITITGSDTGKSSSDIITRPNNTTAYTALDVVSTETGEVLEFANIGIIGENIITSGTIRIDVNAIPAGMDAGFKLHLYSTAPTAIADNSAFNLPVADRTKYLGFITLVTTTDLGDTVFIQEESLNKVIKLTGTSIFGILQTIGAYTPTANVVKTITLHTSSV